MKTVKIITLVGGFGWDCVSLIGGLIICFFPRLIDGDVIFNNGVLDGFLLIDPSTVVINFLIGNEGLSLFVTGGFVIVKRSGGGGPCCWSFSLFSYFYFYLKKKI
jgi:hypothetical protein